MSAKQLRAFLFDPTHADEELFVKNVLLAFEQGHAISIINAKLPKTELDKSIIKCDPTEVISTDNSTTTRSAAIIENPDITTVCFTSGTTGNPKPIEHEISAIESSANALYKILDIEDKTDWLCALPPYFVAGLSILTRHFLKGGELIFHNSFDSKRIQQEIDNGFDGCISLVPFQLESLIEQDIELSNLQAVLVGGGKLEPSLKHKCEDRNIAVHSTYGMTETFGGICHDGIVFDNSHVKILEDEVLIKSGSLFSGYRHDHIATKEKFLDGWFKTNDRGEIRDSKLSIWGRCDDVINSGGVKIDPNIVEKHIFSLVDSFKGFVGKTEHSKYGQCCTVFVEEDNISLQSLRARLSSTLPKSHLPLRIALIPKLFYSNTGKLNRTLSARNFTIVQDHKVQ